MAYLLIKTTNCEKIIIKMKFTIQKNIILENPETKPFLADTFVPENREKLPMVIFCHGYKGYKDWGRGI